jgi:nucleotide-binding universal stress UspA family protein
MALKNVMVHLDQDPRTSERLKLAVALAKRHGARLVGVFGKRSRALRVGVVTSWPTPEFTQACEESKALFAQATEGLAGAEWRFINRGSHAEVLRLFIDLARHTDLVILGQHEHGKENLHDDLAAEVIVGCGRPVLVVPYVGDFATIGECPLIAWNNAPEAARALNYALPLMEGCALAHVLSISARKDDCESTSAEIASHLGAHGIQVKNDMFVVEDFGIMDMVLNRASDRGADLLVMGAHGNIGFPFESRGAGTRYILEHMTLPVLMSN